jgi:hypothetical protein
LGLAAAIILIAFAAPSLAYQIGHTSATFIDASRANREVPTEIYYPADVPGDDVPPATPPPGGFPVVVFGHGYLISWSDYEYLWEALTPSGFLVALPRTGGELFPNHLDFGRDLAFVSRALRAEGSDPSSPLFGLLSGTAAVGGHSMGGGASFLGVSEDTTVQAIFNLAAAETDPSAIAAAGDISVPALVFSGSLDCVTPPATNQTPMYEALSSWCKTHVTIVGASHCQFAESNFFCNLGESGCPDPTITRTEQQSKTAAVLEPWLRATIGSDPASWATFQTVVDTLAGITYVEDCPASEIPCYEEGRSSKQDAVSRVQVSPNPSSGLYRIAFSLRRSAGVRLEVVSARGRLVARLMDDALPAGVHAAEWDGRSGEGVEMASGIYFYRLTADGHVRSGRLVLTR